MQSHCLYKLPVGYSANFQESSADTPEIFSTSSSWACFSPPIKVPGFTERRELTPLLSVALLASAGSHRIKFYVPSSGSISQIWVQARARREESNNRHETIVRPSMHAQQLADPEHASCSTSPVSHMPRGTSARQGFNSGCAQAYGVAERKEATAACCSLKSPGACLERQDLAAFLGCLFCTKRCLL